MSNNDLSPLIDRIEHLEAEVFGNKENQPKAESKQKEPDPPQLDFSINIRAFSRRFIAGKSGPKRFVLLLAYLAKGEVGKNVVLADLRKEWQKMKGKNNLGQFNSFYPNEAKSQGWVDSAEHGTYCLSNSWRESCE